MASKTLGIIGTEAIGFRVAEIAKAFKMQLLGYDKYPNLKRAEEVEMKYVNLKTLLRESDVVTNHVTLTSETEKLIGKRDIASMKNGAVIVNTAQGKVIDEKALVEALKSGRIACAALDVLEEEPPTQGNLSFRLDNVVKFVEEKRQNICQN